LSRGYPSRVFTSLCSVIAIGLAALVLGFGAPVGFLAWLTLVASMAGAWMGPWSRSWRAWTPPLAWGLALLMTRGLPMPWMAAFTIASLYAIGMGLGSWLPRERAAGSCLLLVAALSLAPTFGGHLERPLPPAVTARLLDLSPVAWTLESAGVDWMRHPAVYEAAGTANIDPSMRTQHRNWLAAATLLVVGCLLALSSKTRTLGSTET